LEKTFSSDTNNEEHEINYFNVCLVHSVMFKAVIKLFI